MPVQTKFRNCIFHEMDGLEIQTGWKVIPPNKVLEDKQGKTVINDNHMVLTVLPVGSDAFVVSGDGGKHDWIVQITVRIKNGIGELVATRQVDAIAAHFPLLTVLELDGLRFKQVTRPMSVPPLVGDGWYSVPVQFRYQLIN